MTRVRALWRYPVKSMQGESLTEARIGHRGIVGDREWAIVDTETGLALTGRRQPELLFAHAAVVENGVQITLPDGSIAADDTALSAWLGRPVTLTQATDTTIGTYEIGLADDDDADHDPSVQWFQWQGPAGVFHDSTRTQVSIIGAATIGEWDMRRFRPNVVVEGTGEDSWVGSTLEMGDAELDIVKPIDRCVMTTRPQPGGIDRDIEVLRTINRERSTHLGVGGLVIRAGQVAVGDRVVSG